MSKYVVHRLDGNHQAIVNALRRVGATVYLGGPLDAIVGFRGTTVLMEFKTARGNLQESQRQFILSWRGGTPAVVRGVDAALRAIGAIQ